MIASHSSIVPTENDVLTTARVAIARRFDNHPGNLRFKALIESKKDAYQHPLASRTDKTKLIESIIHSIHSSGSRFLCIDDSRAEWSVLSCRRMTDKISHALRKKTQITAHDAKTRSKSVDLFRLLAHPSFDLDATIPILSLGKTASRSDTPSPSCTPSSRQREMKGSVSTYPEPITLEDLMEQQYYFDDHNGDQRAERHRGGSSQSYLDATFPAAIFDDANSRDDLDEGLAEEVLELLSSSSS